MGAGERSGKAESLLEVCDLVQGGWLMGTPTSFTVPGNSTNLLTTTTAGHSSRTGVQEATAGVLRPHPLLPARFGMQSTHYLQGASISGIETGSDPCPREQRRLKTQELSVLFWGCLRARPEGPQLRLPW